MTNKEPELKPITIWRRITSNDSDLKVEHNHFDDGHIGGISPIGHSSWVKYLWMKSFSFLVNNKVIN